MIKKIALSLVLVSGLAFGQAKKVVSSDVHWWGYKIAKTEASSHDGTVNVKNGTVVLKKNALVGGTFVLDMTSINATDLQGEYQGKLNGHLKADDFFGTEKFPTAKLNFKKVVAKSANVYTVTGDLTIKGITKPITFDLTTTANSATTKFMVDRTKYDIKYGSGTFFTSIGDKAIADEFELDVTLKF